MSRRIRQAAAVLALAAGMGGASPAAPVNLDGTFLWFNSFLGADRTSFVNGTALTPGAPISSTRYLSNTVNFTAPTTTVAFNYDPACCGFVFPAPYVNSFEFIAAPQANVSAGDIFLLGAFRFTNGQWWERADVGFRLTSHSADPTLDGHPWEGTLRLISVAAIPAFVDPNADARREADYFWVLERPGLGSMRVYDRFRQPQGSPGWSESFAIYGRIGSLIPTSIVALGSAGFTDPSIQPGLSGPDVPEPGTLALLGIGLLGLGFTSRFGRLLRSTAMRYCLRRILAAAVAVGVGVPMLQATSVVTTGGFFYGYTGPVGYPIYSGLGGPPYKDGASAYDSYFSPNGAWPATLLAPQWPYYGYEGSSFNGAGFASLRFAPSQTVEFWNRVANTVDTAHNMLTINGAVTPGVAIDPLTSRSNLILLATVVFLNGSWFGSEPAYDPGNGPLYGEGAFEFSLVAFPDPFIGSSGFPGYHVWNDTLMLVTTFGASRPDRLYFQNSSWLGPVNVGEGVNGSFEIWGRIGSLEPVELRNPSAGITLGDGSAVPEPSTLLLAGLGLLTVLICRRPAKRSGRPGFEIHR
jgi:hypothetical protein